MTRLHLLRVNALRTRAVQDTISAVVLAYAALALYLTGGKYGFEHLPPAGGCAVYLIDLCRVLAVWVGRSQKGV